jgi:phosphoadenosine phosphosulfate reductase
VSLDLRFLNQRFEPTHPRHILEWAFSYVDDVAIACSFQLGGLCLAWMAKDFMDKVPVLFLQTGFHFPETIEFRDKVVKEWNLDLVETRPTLGPERQAKEIGPELYKTDPDACCQLNKVLPLQEQLERLGGWITGIRRDQGAARRYAPIVERQTLNSGREIWKINPLARWTREDIEEFADLVGVPRHPLYAEGYQSIGCAPCTRAVLPGEGERAGRWDGGKLECGIHTFGGTAEQEAAEALTG